MTTYAERFAAALRDTLPDGFTVDADNSLAWATYQTPTGRAALNGWTPTGDRRASIDRDTVTAWIEQQAAKVRRQMPHYTVDALSAARAMLDALSRAGVTA
jgi:hypothetical protein